MKILLIDNYDSFTFNLYHYISSLKAKVDVIRNNKINSKEIIKKKYDKIVISPGPGNPNQAGNCINIVKTLYKKIPILGALVGAGLAYKRFRDGDYLGAGAELVSGIASIFPGVGTAASVAIDAALLAGDMKGVTGTDNPDAVERRRTGGVFGTARSAEGDELFLNDFTIRANPKDTITMAGGTKLGGNVEALLQELIDVVKEGGNVFLDGTSVGDALVLNSRLTN